MWDSRLDEDGIPETAEGRIAVGRKIIKTAASYGIGPVGYYPRRPLHDSQLGITRGADYVRDSETDPGRAGSKSVLGVSNISFGLPQREIINSSFFTMAMECGLNGAIINPQFRGYDAAITASMLNGPGSPVQPVY